MKRDRERGRGRERDRERTARDTQKLEVVQYDNMCGGLVIRIPFLLFPNLPPPPQHSINFRNLSRMINTFGHHRVI